MPEFIAVQCFKCKQYQVSQKRKDSKFNCKLCSAKQSVRKVIAHTDKAADVRKFIQQLNLARGRAEERYDELNAEEATEEDGHRNTPFESSSQTPDMNLERIPLGQSRWKPLSLAVTKRVRTPDPDNADDSHTENDIVTVLPEIASKRRGTKRKRGVKQRRGQRQNNQEPRVDEAPSRSTDSKNNEFSPRQWQDRCPWRAIHLPGTRPATNISSRQVLQSPRLRNNDSGSVPLTNQSARSSTAQTDSLKKRWGVTPPQRPQAPRQNNTRLSSDVSAVLDSDGFLTSLGADEVVQDEILY